MFEFHKKRNFCIQYDKRNLFEMVINFWLIYVSEVFVCTFLQAFCAQMSELKWETLHFSFQFDHLPWGAENPFWYNGVLKSILCHYMHCSKSLIQKNLEIFHIQIIDSLILCWSDFGRGKVLYFIVKIQKSFKIHFMHPWHIRQIQFKIICILYMNRFSAFKKLAYYLRNFLTKPVKKNNEIYQNFRIFWIKL
jgi:hypothetical protein